MISSTKYVVLARCTNCKTGQGGMNFEKILLEMNKGKMRIESNEEFNRRIGNDNLGGPTRVGPLVVFTKPGLSFRQSDLKDGRLIYRDPGNAKIFFQILIPKEFLDEPDLLLAIRHMVEGETNIHFDVNHREIEIADQKTIKIFRKIPHLNGRYNNDNEFELPLGDGKLMTEYDRLSRESAGRYRREYAEYEHQLKAYKKENRSLVKKIMNIFRGEKPQPPQKPGRDMSFEALFPPTQLVRDIENTYIGFGMKDFQGSSGEVEFDMDLVPQPKSKSTPGFQPTHRTSIALGYAASMPSAVGMIEE